MNMSQDIKSELLPKLRARYGRRNRQGKSRMLDELCEDHGYERKYAIKLLRDRVPAPSGRAHPGPEPRYALIEPFPFLLPRPSPMKPPPALIMALLETTRFKVVPGISVNQPLELITKELKALGEPKTPTAPFWTTRPASGADTIGVLVPVWPSLSMTSCPALPNWV